jgi:uracil-DNA glycosylase family 4
MDPDLRPPTRTGPGSAPLPDGLDASAALEQLTARLIGCRRCPRLVDWRERTGHEKRAAYADEDYWARPVPGFGDPRARVIVVGLAPAAHGANRTGRMFTGDRSGDFLYASLHRTGFASQPTSARRGDGLTLTDCWVTAAVRCAPPANSPTAAERDACAPWLAGELDLLPARVLVALGGFAWQAVLRTLGPVRPRPRFGHGTQAEVAGLPVLGSYHPSQQNTFTGRLTPSMLDDVFVAARTLLDA